MQEGFWESTDAVRLLHARNDNDRTQIIDRNANPSRDEIRHGLEGISAAAPAISISSKRWSMRPTRKQVLSGFWSLIFDL